MGQLSTQQAAGRGEASSEAVTVAVPHSSLELTHGDTIVLQLFPDQAGVVSH